MLNTQIFIKTYHLTFLKSVNNFPSDFHDGVLTWERTDCCAKFLLHVMYMSLRTLSRLVLSRDIASLI